MKLRKSKEKKLKKYYLSIAKKSIKKKHFLSSRELKKLNNYLKGVKTPPKVINFTIDDINEFLMDEAVAKKIGEAAYKKACKEYGYDIAQFEYVINVHLSNIKTKEELEYESQANDKKGAE